jgi:cobalt-zinc-cadmium efflux system membrane fusion protein
MQVRARLRRFIAVAAIALAAFGGVGTYAASSRVRGIIRSALGVDPMVKKAPAELPSPYQVAGERITVPTELMGDADLEWRQINLVTAPHSLTLTGRTGLNMETVAHVHTQFPGRLMTLGPALGASVVGPSGGQPGTLLCQIESVDLAQAKSDYEKARVQVSVDQDTRSRTALLVQSGVVSDKAQFDAENAVRRSQADLEAARQRLMVFGLTEADLPAIEHQLGRQRMLYDIVSPRDGVISEKNCTPGELADTTVNLFTIADMASLWVWGDVYERDWAKVRVGQPMTVYISGAPGEPVRCSIDWISPVIDGPSRCVRVRGTIANPDRRLLADMYATVTVTLDTGDNALVVPKTAVVRRGDGGAAASLFVRVGADERTTTWERRAVRVEAIDAATDRVIAGLSPGDIVLTRGGLRLAEEMSR